MTSTPVDVDPELARFSRDIDEMSLMPLWERTSGMQPGSSCVPHLWRYASLRPRLMRAAELITARAAERRVLVLENPSLRGSTFITNTLYTGLQIILPGEVAPAHRHSPSALRFVVEGEGGYTAVGGERATMRPGDFVVTPNWSWHDHGNEGAGPVVWMDGLDTAIAQFFGAVFREQHAKESHPITRSEGDALATYGSNLFPVGLSASTSTSSATSPVLLYPYERTRDALYRLSRGAAIDPAHGFKVRYTNPATGGSPFPTMAAFMQWLPAGFNGSAYRSTDGAVFNVAEGSGTVMIDGVPFDFAQHDVFVVPPWSTFKFTTTSSSETVLFSYSDRAAQDLLGLWREERL